MALQDLSGLLQSWKEWLARSGGPGPNKVWAVYYSIAVNSPVFSDVDGNRVTYIEGAFTQHTAPPLTFSGSFKASAYYSDKLDLATGQRFDVKQREELAVTLTDAVQGSGATHPHPATITCGHQVYHIVDVRNQVIIAVLDDAHNPAVLTLTSFRYYMATTA